MNQQLQIFNHPEFGKVRVIEIDGEPYFVGTDVAIALGYANPQKALRDHVPDKFKRTERIVHPQGGAQDSIVISEAGMYKLVFKSKLPNAEKFSDWTCEEVLPSIRKTGVYVNEKITGDFVIALGMRLKEIEAQNSLLTTQVAELQPKASYYDIVLQCRDLVSTSQIAKDYGMSGKAFNALLHNLCVQFNQGGVWLLYQKYARLGWTQTKTHAYKDNCGRDRCRIQTYWTQKGRLGLYDLLKHYDYLPTVEKEI